MKEGKSKVLCFAKKPAKIFLEKTFQTQEDTVFAT